MGKALFYPKLAVSNIRKNHSIYRPYLLAVFLLAAMYDCMASLAIVVAESGISGGGSLSMILGMGAWLLGVLSLLVLFYTNSFLIRRRRREFGLYSVLGMEKRHICLVLVWEVLLVAVGGVVLGMAAGALFSQLFRLLLQRLTRGAISLELWFPLEAVGSTAGVFAGAFALVLVYDVAAVFRSRPMELLRSESQGEREPKARWLLALLGVATLGGGYALALLPANAADALVAFLPAALLVMAGTYCLFTAGSIAILKAMKRCRGFYYRPRNFLTVSTLLYRMKQNAAGLAAICILSTCVLVTMSTTVSLFLGEQDMLYRSYPRMVNVDAISSGDGDLEALEEAAAEAAAQYGVTLSNAVGLRVFSGAVLDQGGGVYTAAPYFGGQTKTLLALTAADYNRIAGADVALAPGEVLVCDVAGPLRVGALQLDGWSFSIAGQLEGQPDFLASEAGGGGSLTVIVPDYETLEAVAARHNEALPADGGTVRLISVQYNFDAAGENLEPFCEHLRELLAGRVERMGNVAVRHWQEAGFYEMYGGLLFIGLFFVALFLIAVVLILYYKQITEGFDDHGRFRILQNVGMSAKEVRRVISRQVLLMFYLPLVMAVVHIAVAFPALCKILQGFQLYNTRLFLLCTAGTAGLFLVFYLLTYRLTARTYYKIVRV